jgi:hypothetical protein
VDIGSVLVQDCGGRRDASKKAGGIRPKFKPGEIELTKINPIPLLSKTRRNLATRVANGSFACPELEF